MRISDWSSDVLFRSVGGAAAVVGAGGVVVEVDVAVRAAVVAGDGDAVAVHVVDQRHAGDGATHRREDRHALRSHDVGGHVGATAGAGGVVPVAEGDLAWGDRERDVDDGVEIGRARV